MSEWHHGYAAGDILRAVAKAFGEAADSRAYLPDFPEFAAETEWLRATSQLVERRARDLSPTAHDLVSDICSGLLESGRALCGTPFGSNRLDYLLVSIANQQPSWIGPLKRRMSWLDTDQPPPTKKRRIEMADRVWILGAPDPEMGAIETLLRECGESIAYALDERGERVTPATSYGSTSVRRSADYREPARPWPTWHMVECMTITPPCTFSYFIDHHQPGDYGYGAPPRDFMRAASIGQVIKQLALIERLPESWESADFPYCGSVGFTVHVPNSGWWVCVQAPGQFVRIPEALVFVAAADHCLGAAYRGECPGVDPDELMRWRAESRARFQGRSVGEILADIEATSDALREALGSDPIFLEPTGPECGDPQCSCHLDSIPRVADMRREPPWPELPEASCRTGIGYVAGPLRSPDGRRKITCGGTAEQIRAFLDHWAPANGLVDCYGDPARGFAGGYLKEQQ